MELLAKSLMDPFLATADVNHEFALATSVPTHPIFWLTFSSNPKLFVGDDLALVVDDKMFGVVVVSAVDHNRDDTWTVFWEGESFEFCN